MSKKDYIFFWGHTNRTGKINKTCLSQWWMSDFTEDGVHFCCAEQYMMYHKAIVFGDNYYAEKIINTKDPRQIKGYGRKIRGFDPNTWDQHKLGIVVQGNYLKFSQNPMLEEYLIGTGDKILVEASPYDSIWGIGMKASEKGVEDPANWRGQNLLGRALMEVRTKIKDLEKAV